jgi:hypothetical protein
MKRTGWIAGALLAGACLMGTPSAKAQYWGGGGRSFGLSINIGTPGYGWGIPGYGYGPAYATGWGIPAPVYNYGWSGVGYAYSTTYVRSYSIAPAPLVIASPYAYGYGPRVIRRPGWGWGPRPIHPGPWSRPYPVRWW